MDEQVETTGTPEIEAPTGTLEEQQAPEQAATEQAIEGGPEREAVDDQAEALRQQLLAAKIEAEKKNARIRELEAMAQRPQSDPAFDPLAALEALDQRLNVREQPVMQQPFVPPAMPDFTGGGGEPSSQDLMLWAVLEETKQMRAALTKQRQDESRRAELTRLSADPAFDAKSCVALIARKAAAGERISMSTAHEILSGVSRRSQEAAAQKLQEDMARTEAQNRRTAPVATVRTGPVATSEPGFIPLATVEQYGLGWYQERLREGYREVPGGLSKR